jgi:hypothetical protein
VTNYFSTYCQEIVNRIEKRGRLEVRSQKPEYRVRENKGLDSPVKPENDG